jgi:hypothetical protein
VILPTDANLLASLPKEGQSCGCTWNVTRTKHGLEQVVVGNVCLVHRRWLSAIMQRARTAPTSFKSVMLVGPTYQQATRHSGGGAAPEHFEAMPRQMGGIARMDGPLYQHARSAVVEKAPKSEIGESEPTLADILGFDPSIIEEKP